jgi:riboflavin kinase / FMN adenylyltransferase
MRILRSYKSIPPALREAALAIGNFDGVHRGHRAVIAAAMAASEDAGAPAGVMTFEPHPREFFKPDAPMFRLTPETVKLELLEEMGLDLAVVLPFNAQLASLSAEAFVTEVLVEGLGVGHVVTGADFQFGKGRTGTPELLREMGGLYGFGVTVVAPQGEGDTVFSSTAIRERLAAGDMPGAAELLGYWWRVSGTVVGGDKRGHGLGFPTANITAPPGFGLARGIYAVRVRAVGIEYHGAAYFGTRPTFDDGDAVIETFLFDFSGDLYGKEIELEFIAFLRGDEKFADGAALKAQMKADCQKAEAILAEVAASGL